MVSQCHFSQFVQDLLHIKLKLIVHDAEQLLSHITENMPVFLRTQERTARSTLDELDTLRMAVHQYNTRLQFAGKYDLATSRGSGEAERVAERGGITFDVHTAKKLRRELKELKIEMKEFD